MKITRQDHDDLNATITLIVEKDDYSSKLTEELKKHRAKAHMKGFRKGKTPMSVVKKMYGKSVLAEIINKVIDDSISGFIKDEKLDILGSPIPTEDQEMIDFDLASLEDYTFKFDIGKAPEVEVAGVSNSDTYTKYAIDISDELLTEELDLRRKQRGENIDVEDGIEEEDILTIKALELEGDVVKEKGWETGFTLLVSRIGNEDLQKEVLTKKIGDKITFNIFELEKDATEEHVRKYLLNLDEDEDKEIGKHFEGTIEKVSRRMLAEMNDEFFDAVFPGGEVKTEADAKEKIAEDIAKYYDDQSRSVMYREIMEELMKNNSITIPEKFLKRWLKITNRDVSQENLDNEFDAFSKNIEWNLMKSTLVKKYNVVVEPDELRASVKKKIEGYMQQYGALGGMDMEPMIDRMLSNREQIEKEYSEVEADKLFAQIEKEVSIAEKSVSIEEFREIVQKLNENQAA